MKTRMPVSLSLMVVILALAGGCLIQEVAPPAAAAKPGKIKIACVGDSITACGYPAVLNKMLGDKYEVLNLGVSGATLMKHGDFSYWMLGKIEEAGKFGPDIVTIMLGTNDAKPQNYHQHPAEFQADYEALIKAFRNLDSKPKVYVMIPVPVFANGAFGIDGSVLRKEISPLIVQAAKDTDCEMIDLYTPLAASSGLFPDTVHPSGDGAEAIAGQMCHAINGAPVFESDGNIFLDSITVKMSVFKKADIRYTLDGSEPTVASPRYRKSLVLTATTTVKAIAVGEKASPVTQETFTKVVPRDPVKPGHTSPGLRYGYYENNDAKALDNPSQLTPVRSGVTNDFQLAAEQGRKEFWGYRWTGYLTVPADGIYTFRISSDDGSNFRIGDTLLVDNPGQHSAIERQARIALKAGAHPITMIFYNLLSGWSFKAEWEGPGIERQLIPAAALSHDEEAK